MSVEITALTDLDADQTAQSLAQTTQRVQEASPTVDVKRGVFHDLLLLLHSLLDSQLRSGLLDRYLSARSLLDIQADPSLADTEVVDRVLSNYRITRGAGSSAVGEVTIVLSRSTSVTIGSGAVFTANSMAYTSDAAYTAKTEASQINSDTDRLLTQLDSGNWAFTINVTAVLTGPESLLLRNTLIIPAALPAAYVTSYASADFTGGLNIQTNSELLEQLQQGISCKAPSNRITMQAMLLAQTEFSRIGHSSIVGAGDAEMIRDQHTIWPGSLGGRCDWYIRTAERVQRVTLTRTATLLSKENGGGTWRVSLGRDAAPGFYEIVSILKADAADVAGGFAITSDDRGLDLTGDGFVPDIQTVAEGAYSRFQTAVVKFFDDMTDYTDLAVGATADYSVVVSLMPQIAEIQDFISSFDVRSYGADILVKAPVPCFVQLYFRIAKTRKQADPDTDAIKAALATAISNIDFVGRLYAAQLQDVIGGFLPEGMSVGAVDMLGRLKYPDGSIHYIRDNEMLKIDFVDGAMVSSRTAQFFLDVDDITTEIVTEIPVPA